MCDFSTENHCLPACLPACQKVDSLNISSTAYLFALFMTLLALDCNCCHRDAVIIQLNVAQRIFLLLLSFIHSFIHVAFILWLRLLLCARFSLLYYTRHIRQAQSIENFMFAVWPEADRHHTWMHCKDQPSTHCHHQHILKQCNSIDTRPSTWYIYIHLTIHTQTDGHDAHTHHIKQYLEQ